MPFSASHTTKTTIDAFVPEIWSKDVQLAARAKYVMANLVMRFDSMVKKGGDTIKIPKISTGTANDKVASQQVTLQANTETTVDLSIDKHKESSYLIEDLAEIQTEVDLRSVYTTEAGEAIAKQIDSDLLALYASVTNSVGGASAIDADDILDAKEKLDLANAPETDRYLVVHPTAVRDLLDISTFVSSDYVDGKPVVTGMLGTIYGFKVYSSTQVPLATTYKNLAFHKSAFMMASQLSPRVQASYEQIYLSNLVTVDTVYGVGIYRNDHACVVLSN